MRVMGFSSRQCRLGRILPNNAEKSFQKRTVDFELCRALLKDWPSGRLAGVISQQTAFDQFRMSRNQFDINLLLVPEKCLFIEIIGIIGVIYSMCLVFRRLQIDMHIFHMVITLVILCRSGSRSPCEFRNARDGFLQQGNASLAKLYQITQKNNFRKRTVDFELCRALLKDWPSGHVAGVISQQAAFNQFRMSICQFDLN